MDKNVKANWTFIKAFFAVLININAFDDVSVLCVLLIRKFFGLF